MVSNLFFVSYNEFDFVNIGTANFFYTRQKDANQCSEFNADAMYDFAQPVILEKIIIVQSIQTPHWL